MSRPFVDPRTPQALRVRREQIATAVLAAIYSHWKNVERCRDTTLNDGTYDTPAKMALRAADGLIYRLDKPPVEEAKPERLVLRNPGGNAPPFDNDIKIEAEGTGTSTAA
jgi:hypothetical protein